MLRLAIFLFGLAAFAQTGEVHTILSSRCLGCHGGSNPQAGFSLATRDGLLKGGVSGPALIAGNSASSLLLRRVTGELQPVMPMGGTPLSEREIGVLRSWIDQGAAYHLKPPDAPPAAPNYTLALRKVEASGVDEIVDRYFTAHRVRPASAVPDETFLRRAYLDIWGLLPTPAQRAEFLTLKAANKRALLIDELLAHPRNYAEHWITFWSDLLHNDNGNYAGDRKSITSWLMGALMWNLPYDRFVETLLNPRADEHPDGFLLGVNWRGDINASQMPVMQAAQNSAQVFLGINLKCNSCHDSFISRWKLKDAYGLASFFAETPLDLVRCDVPTGETSQIKFLFPSLGNGPAEGALRERRAAAAALFTKRENGLFARTIVNRMWRQLLGRGLVEPIDEMESDAWSNGLLDWLAQDLIGNGYDLKHLLRRIMNSRAYRLPVAKAAKGKEFIFRGPVLRRLSAEQFLDNVSAITGEWRIRTENRPVEGIFTREWGLKSNPVSRALGRPVRDAAVTERLTDSTTLQAMELVNGETFAALLSEGARRVLGNVVKAPAPLFDSGLLRNAATARANIDITGRNTLRLLIVNVDSYDVPRTRAGWANAVVSGAMGDRPLTELPSTGCDARESTLDIVKTGSFPALIPPLGCEVVYDLTGLGLTRLKAQVAIDAKSIDSAISPAVRAFVYAERPDRKRLIPGRSEPPVERPEKPTSVGALVERVFRHALGRAPIPAERAAAASAKLTQEGVEDFLWTMFLSPEFQYIR